MPPVKPTNGGPARAGPLVSSRAGDRAPAPPGEDADPLESPPDFKGRGRCMAVIGARRSGGGTAREGLLLRLLLAGGLGLGGGCLLVRLWLGLGGRRLGGLRRDLRLGLGRDLRLGGG